MSLSDLSKQIEERYLQYLKTTFYFADPALRASFAEALKSGGLSKGPYLEATPVFRRGQTPRSLFANLLNSVLLMKASLVPHTPTGLFINIKKRQSRSHLVAETSLSQRGQEAERLKLLFIPCSFIYIANSRQVNCAPVCVP